MSIGAVSKTRTSRIQFFISSNLFSKNLFQFETGTSMTASDPFHFWLFSIQNEPSGGGVHMVPVLDWDRIIVCTSTITLSQYTEDVNFNELWLLNKVSVYIE